MIKIIGIDLDGGDFSAQENLPAVISYAQKNKSVKVKSYTKESIQIKLPFNLEIVTCKEEINDDDTILSIRKKSNSSLIKMLNDLKSRKIHSAISAGNSGVLFGGSTLILGTLFKDLKPAFAPLITNVKTGEPLLILDGGANIENTSSEILSYAKIGTSLIENYMKIKAKVGLINNGVEKKKGDELHREFYNTLSESKKINFIGNVEPRDLLSSNANVIVTDGWSGNIMVKSYEGMARSMLFVLKKEFKKKPRFMLGAILLKKAFKNANKNFDYREYGASVVLGVNDIVLKMHGESDQKAFYNALSYANSLIESDFIKKIKL